MSTFLPFFFIFATLGTFGYFLYELIWLHERFWQPLLLSVMTLITFFTSIGTERAGEETEQQKQIDQIFGQYDIASHDYAISLHNPTFVTSPK